MKRLNFYKNSINDDEISIRDIYTFLKNNYKLIVIFGSIGLIITTSILIYIKKYEGSFIAAFPLFSSNIARLESNELITINLKSEINSNSEISKFCKDLNLSVKNDYIEVNFSNKVKSKVVDCYDHLSKNIQDYYTRKLNSHNNFLNEYINEISEGKKLLPDKLNNISTEIFKYEYIKTKIYIKNFEFEIIKPLEIIDTAMPLRILIFGFFSGSLLGIFIVVIRK